MPFDGERPNIVSDAVAGSKAIAQRAMTWWARYWPAVSEAGARLGGFLMRLPVVRWFSRSLARRIILSNAVGLLILLGGYLYLNQYKDWLVDAKLDPSSPKVRIRGVAIMGGVNVERKHGS